MCEKTLAAGEHYYPKSDFKLGCNAIQQIIYNLSLFIIHWSGPEKDWIKNGWVSTNFKNYFNSTHGSLLPRGKYDCYDFLKTKHSKRKKFRMSLLWIVSAKQQIQNA